MTTAVANKAGTAMAMIQSLKAGIANVQQTLVKKGGDPFLRFLKDGTWVYGQDDTDVQDGSLWAVNPLSIRHGWIAWKRGENVDNSGGPLNEIMVPASTAKPSELELPELADKSGRWDQAYSFTMKCMTGEDVGEQTMFKTNSVGGIDAVDKLLKAIGIQLDSDPEKCVPCVQLLGDSYQHKTRGKIYVPIMKIVQWIALTDDLPDLHEEQAAAAEPEKPAETAAPAKRTRKASVPATGAGKAADAPLDEDPEIAAMMAAIAAKKAAKTAGTTAPVESEADKRKRELREQLAALEEDDQTDAEETLAADPAPAAAAGEPIRRRRPAA